MSESSKRNIAIIGAGPAGLMAAEVLSRNDDNNVTIFEAMPSAGRKFLMAGRGGLNLTHTEPLETFLTRYGAREDDLSPHIKALSPKDVRTWCEALGQYTFVGSSGRVFPKAMKASGLLRAWLRRLGDRGVVLKTRHRWTGWSDHEELRFASSDGQQTMDADATILALGGASWPKLGSDANWIPVLRNARVTVTPFRPANCGFTVAWSDVFKTRFEGQPLKGVALTHDGRTVRGEAMVTAAGIEGGAIYALSAKLRDAVLANGSTTLEIDLKPDVKLEKLTTQLQKPRGKQSMATYLRKAIRLSPVRIGLIHEMAKATGTPASELSPEALAQMIKSVSVKLNGVAPIDRAISSAGGVGFDEVDQSFMLKQVPGFFVAGEMLDWEAPTGGYLLQACFATGAAAGKGVEEWLDAQTALQNAD